MPAHISAPMFSSKLSCWTNYRWNGTWNSSNQSSKSDYLISLKDCSFQKFLLLCHLLSLPSSFFCIQSYRNSVFFEWFFIYKTHLASFPNYRSFFQFTYSVTFSRSRTLSQSYFLIYMNLRDDLYPDWVFAINWLLVEPDPKYLRGTRSVLEIR